MKEKIFCIVCGVRVNKPVFIWEIPYISNSEKPIEYKDGWKCSQCSKKR